MTYAPEGENARARDIDGMEENLEGSSALDYLWSAPAEEPQAPLQAAAEAPAAHGFLRPLP